MPPFGAMVDLHRQPSVDDTRMANKVAASVAAAARVLATRSPAASAPPGLDILYSTHPSWPYLAPAASPSPLSSASPPPSATTQPKPSMSLDIAVVDSSFNPPTKAHLALGLSPPLASTSPIKRRHYDAHLLLFSTDNADKGKGKKGDASLDQRVYMMTLLAKQVERELHTQQAQPNVAVALVDRPLIFDKSTVVLDTLAAREQQQQQQTPPVRPRPRLHWVVGFDLLYRIFQLKYYPSEDCFDRQCSTFFETEGTSLVCARRDAASFPALSPSSSQDADATQRQEAELLASEKVQRWMQKGSIVMLDLEPTTASLSSTQIREVLRDKRQEAPQKKAELQTMVPPLLVDFLLESGVYVQGADE
ncbi:hypothetical protein ACQY0O_006825 [Thecaphora frezii]